MQLTEELTKVLSKHGYKNIESYSRQKTIESMIADKEAKINLAKEESIIKSYKAQIDVLSNTLFVASIFLISRDDNERTLDCEKCRSRTNVLIAITKDSKQRVCEKCLDIELTNAKKQVVAKEVTIKTEVKKDKKSKQKVSAS